MHNVRISLFFVRCRVHRPLLISPPAAASGLHPSVPSKYYSRSIRHAVPTARRSKLAVQSTPPIPRCADARVRQTTHVGPTNGKHRHTVPPTSPRRVFIHPGGRRLARGHDEAHPTKFRPPILPAIRPRSHSQQHPADAPASRTCKSTSHLASAGRALIG